jgi:GT2 family glycosyltransferase
MIDLALDESDDRAFATQRAEWASHHDWSSRRESLVTELENIHPKVSVVMLCYNNLEFTKACIKSLLGVGTYSNLELIVVDNGSSDGTKEYMQELKSEVGHLRLIVNENNLGFSAGNNVGIKAATGDYIILLNNDTYVTPGWVFGLVRHLRRNPKLGLVSPVTNNIGNEAKIDVDYADMESMFLESFKYTSSHRRELLYVPTVAFFCVAFSRELVEKVGLLDEQFGQGFFEDDDYCRRVSDAGYQVAIAEDVFVHHELSATFSKERKERRQELFEINKKKFEEKWGEWKPHEYRR